MRIDVMQGNLRDFDLAAVLQVVGLGRQYTGVELHSDGGRRGVVYIKGGKVVRVEADDLTGERAFSKLFRVSDGAFYVFRADTPEVLPEPVGSLSQLLMAIRPDSAAPDSAAPGSAAPGSPTTASEQTLAPAKSESAPPAVAIPRSLRAAQLPSRTANSSGRCVVAIASPKGGCGKSTIALNLALSLARRGNSVMLIDADINGDVLSSLDARDRVKVGALDVINEKLPLRDAVLDTALGHFKIVPAVGNDLPQLDVLEADHTDAWRALLDEAASQAEVVVVDTPAGMFGTTRQVLASCTHVIGVLQAEAIAERSFQRFVQGLAQLAAPPEVLGIVLNMLQTRQSASLSVFQNACEAESGQWLFDTTIPRNPAFLNAAFEGTPLRPLDDQAPPAVGFLFDNLASEVAERLQLAAPKRRAQSLLL